MQDTRPAHHLMTTRIIDESLGHTRAPSVAIRSEDAKRRHRTKYKGTAGILWHVSPRQVGHTMISGPESSKHVLSRKTGTPGATTVGETKCIRRSL